MKLWDWVRSLFFSYNRKRCKACRKPLTPNQTSYCSEECLETHLCEQTY